MIMNESDTIIEYRDCNHKLHEMSFDESLEYIKKSIASVYERGASEFVVVCNRRDYDFFWLNDYQ
jgi:hypothetical protein